MGPLSQSINMQPNLLPHQEFRLQENRALVISVVNGEVSTSQVSNESGLSSRTHQNGLFGFAASPELTAAALEKALRKSADNFENLNSSQRSRTRSAAQYHLGSSKHLQALMTINRPLSQKELIDEILRFDSYVKAKEPKLMARRFTLREQDFKKEVQTGTGGHGFSHFVRCHLYMDLTMDSANGPVEIMKVFGGRGFAGDMIPDFETFKSAADAAIDALKRKCEGVYARAGEFDVILDSKLAGILAHEAVGHTTEADLVRGGSIAGDLMNQRVASPLVTLVDFAHTALGTECPVPVLLDDECTKASDTMIIEEGVLRNYMHSLETASEFGHTATGHSRAWGFSDEPLIRMRNTAILPGNSSLNQMIESIEDGYYLLDHSNGQADSTGEFMFGVTQGFEIKNGKLGKPILDTTISGMAFDMLKSVSMVSDEMKWVDSGTCGKKQPMYVGMGGPAIKCKINLGGRS